MGGRVLLFLAAVFVPCAVLIGLTVRLASQDRELRTRHQADERRLIAERTRDRLLALLGSLRADEIMVDLEPGQTYRHPETLLVAWSEDGRLVLPWEPEHDRAVRHAREQLSTLETQARTCHSEPCYRHLMETNSRPSQSAFLSWLLAQMLESAGQHGSAHAILAKLLDDDAAFTDADDVPLRLLAARALAQHGDASAGSAQKVQASLAGRPWLPPMLSFVTTEVAERLASNDKAAEDLSRWAASKVQLLQQAEALQNDFPRIQALLANRAQPAWAPFGDDLWLVNLQRSTVMAVQGRDLFRRVAVTGALRLADAREPAGEPLGETFPGLSVMIDGNISTAPDPFLSLQRQLLYVALTAVIAVTILAAYLLWRDLQREVRASELRAQFVASVSHELKTPLTSIRMFAETLQMGRFTDPQVQSEYLGTIVSECERLSRLVDGVLMFSKAEQGKKTYRFREVQPSASVQAAVRALEFPLAQQGFRLHVKVEDGLPLIQADEDALEQATLNLLSNAIKFSGDARDIEVALFREGDEVVTRVTDHGVGIAPDEQARIFDKFYRVPSADNQSISGSGLGLTLVSQIMKAHGGRVTVESAPGRGSTFSLRLPAGTADEPKQEVNQ